MANTVRIHRFSNPDRLRTLDPTLLSQLLASYKSFLLKRKVLSRTSNRIDLDALAKELSIPAEDFPGPLLNAIWLVDTVATEGMRDYLERAARNAGHFNLAGAPILDLAVSVHLADSKAIERILGERAADRRESFTLIRPTEACETLQGLPSVETLAKFQSQLTEEFTLLQFGHGVKVFPSVGGGQLRFVIRHGGHLQRIATHGSDGECDSLTLRPMEYDVVLYECDSGTLHVSAKSKREKRLYCEVLGQHLCGNATLYDVDDAREGMTLRPLIERGRACLECSNIPDLLKVRLVSATIDHDDDLGTTKTIASDDVFETMTRENTSFPKYGSVTRAELVFTVRGENEDFDVHTKLLLPDKTRQDRSQHIPAITQFFKQAGFWPGKLTEQQHVVSTVP